MTNKTTLAVTALTTTALLFGARTADASGWRCMDNPGENRCPDDLVNDIETILREEWRNPLTIAMPPLPYSCSRASGGGNPVAPEDKHELVTGSTGQFLWSVTFATNSRAFVIGQDVAVADIAGGVSVSGPQVTPASWTGMNLAVGFAASGSEVVAPEGPTGVADLGVDQYTTRSGDFWNSDRTVRFTYQGVRDGDYTCTVGPPEARIRATGRNSVRINYPVPWQDLLVAFIREEFRRAARAAALGAP